MTPPLIEALRREVMDALMACAEHPYDEQRIGALTDIYLDLSGYQTHGTEVTQEEAAQLRALLAERA